MNVGRKILNIFAVLLILMGTLIPSATLSAASVDYTTTDFYLANDKGEKVNTIDIADKDSFEVQLVKENNVDSRLELGLPDGITLDQEATQTKNEDTALQIAYSKEINNVIVNFADEKDDSSEENKTEETDADDKEAATLVLQKEYSYNGEDKLVAKATRDDATVYSEPVFLTLGKEDTLEETEDVNVIDNTQSVDKNDSQDVKNTEKSKNEVTNDKESESPKPSTPKVSTVKEVGGSLAVKKRAVNANGEDIPSVFAGKTFYYQIELTNSDPEDEAENVVIDDVIPTDVRRESGKSYIDGQHVNDDQVWASSTTVHVEVGTLNPGDTFIVRFGVNYNTVGETKEITNRATAKSDNDTVTASVTITGFRRGPLTTISKVAMDENGNTVTNAELGDTVYYEITAANDAQILSIYDITIRDELKSYLEYKPGTTTIDGKVVSDEDVWDGKNLAVKVDEIKAGKEMKVKFAAKINGADADKIAYNTATAGQDWDEDPHSATAEVEVIFPNTADLDVNIDSVNANDEHIDTVKSGEYYYYKITIKNVDSTNVAEDVKVEDNLPERLRAGKKHTSMDGVLLDDDDVWEGTKFSVTIPTIKRGQTVEIKLYTSGIDTTYTGDVTNTVQVYNAGGSFVEESNTIRHTRAGVVPTLSKRAIDENGETINRTQVNDDFQYELSLYNGSKTLSVYDTTLEDKLPEYLTYDPGTTTVNGYNIPDEDAWNSDGTVMEYLIDEMKPGVGLTIRFRVHVNAAESAEVVYNTASVWQYDMNRRQATNEILTTPEPSQNPKVEVDKKAIDENGEKVELVKINDQVHYEVTTSNHAHELPANETIIEDTLEDYLEYVPDTTTVKRDDGIETRISDNVWRNKTLTYTTDIAAGKSVTVGFDAKVIESPSGNNVAINMAKAGEDVQEDQSTSVVEIVVDDGTGITDPVVTASKEVLDSEGNKLLETNKDDVIYFEVSATNTAQTLASRDVVIRDELNSYLKYQSGTTTMRVNDGEETRLEDSEVWGNNILNYTVDVPASSTVTVRFAVKVNGSEFTGVATNMVTTGQATQEEPSTAEVEVLVNHGEGTEDPRVLTTKRALDENGDVVDHIEKDQIIYYEVSAINTTHVFTSHDVVISDELNDYLQYVPETTTVDGVEVEDDGIWNDNTLTYTTDIEADSIVTVKFAVQVNGSEDTHLALNTVYAGQEDQEDKASATVEVVVTDKDTGVSDPKVTVEKGAISEDFIPVKQIDKDGEFYYEILVRNTSKTIASRDVVITDVLEDYIEYKVDTTWVNGSYVRDEDVWNDRTLTVKTDVEAGSTASVRFKVKVIGSGDNHIAKNTVVAGQEEQEDKDSSTVEVLVNDGTGITDPKVSVNKMATDTSGKEITDVGIGEEVYYEIVVENTAETFDSKNVIITDELAGYLEYQPGTTTVDGVGVIDRDVWNGNTFTYTTDVKAASSVTVRFEVKVNGSETNRVAKNTATAGQQNQVDKDTGTAEVVVKDETGIADPVVDADKKVFDAAGEEITEVNTEEVVYFEVSATNTAETLTSRDVVITDELRSYLQYRPGTTTVNGTPVADRDAWNGNTLTYTTDVEANSTVTVRFAVQVNGSEATGVAINRATAGQEGQQDISMAEVQMLVGNGSETPNPRVEVTKTAIDSNGVELETAKVEDTIYYQIVVTNNTIFDSKDVVVSDELADYLEYNTGTTSIDGEKVEDSTVWKGNNFTYTTNVPAESTVTVRFGVTIKGYEETNNTAINKVMAGQASQEDKATDISELPVNETGSTSPGVSITKKAYDQDNEELITSAVGNEVVYEINVTNNTDTLIAKDVMIEDELDVDLAYVMNSTTIDGKQLDDQDIWSEEYTSLTVKTDVQPKSTVSIKFKVKIVGPGKGDVIVNTASAVPADQDQEVTSMVEITTNPSGNPVVDVEKKAFNTQGQEIKNAKIGDVVKYEITATNPTQTLTSREVVIDDQLEDYLQYQRGTTFVNGKKIVDAGAWYEDALTIIDDIAPKSTLTIEFSVKVEEAGVNHIASNIATAGQATQVAPAMSEAELIIDDGTGIMNPVINVSKKAFDSEGKEVTKVHSGDIVHYELTSTNTTNTLTAENVVIGDELEDYLTYKPGTTTINGELVEDDSTMWNGSTLEYTTDIEPGVDSSVVIAFDVLVEGSQTNAVASNMMTATQVDQEASARAEVVVDDGTGITDPIVEADKKALGETGEKISEVEIGETIYYEVSATNTAKVLSSNNVIITDELASYLEYQPETTTVRAGDDAPTNLADDDVWNGNVLTYQTDVEADSTVTVRFAVKVNGKSSSNTVYNLATAGQEYQTDPSEASVELLSSKTGSPRMDVEKLAFDDEDVQIETVHIGDVISYQLAVTNNSKTFDVTDIVVTDELDTYLGYQKGSTTVNGSEVEDSDAWNGRTLTYTTDIAAGETATIEFEVEVMGVNNKETVYNSMTAGPTGFEDESNSEIELIVEGIIENPEIEAGKRATDGDGNVITDTAKEETIYYEVTATNTASAATAEDVLIIDELESYLEYQAGTTTIDGKPVGDDVWDGNSMQVITDVRAGETVTVRFAVQVNGTTSAGTVYNVASAGQETGDMDTAEVELNATGKANPKLTATKRALDDNGGELDYIVIEDEIYYELTVENNAKMLAAKDVVVFDELETNQTYIDSSTKINGVKVNDSEVWSENVLSYTSDIPAGEMVTVTFTARVDDTNYEGSVYNSMTAGQEGELDPAEDEVELVAFFFKGVQKTTDKARNDMGKVSDGNFFHDQVEKLINLVTGKLGMKNLDFQNGISSVNQEIANNREDTKENVSGLVTIVEKIKGYIKLSIQVITDGLAKFIVPTIKIVGTTVNVAKF